MATKKTEPKTTTTKTKTKVKVPRYVGVNACGDLYLSTGPVQIIDYEYCVWLSKDANIWTSSPDDAKYKVIQVGEYDDLSGEAFACEEEVFVKLYPHIDLGSGSNKKRKVKPPEKQLKFCV